MKYCSQCNQQFDTSGNFCPQCGNRLIEKSNVMFCPNCGKKLEAGTQFCDACGAGIQGSQPDGNVGFGRQPQTQRNKRKYVLAGIAVVLICLLGGAGFYFLNREDSSGSGTANDSSSGNGARNKIVAILPEPISNLLGIKKEENNKIPESGNERSVQQAPAQARTGNVTPVAPPPSAPLPSAPLPPPVAPYNGNTGVYNNNNSAFIRGNDVRIRTGPGLTYDIMGHFYNGERVTIIEVLEGWYKVRRSDNSIGFVSSRFCIRN